MIFNFKKRLRVNKERDRDNYMFLLLIEIGNFKREVIWGKKNELVILGYV